MILKEALEEKRAETAHAIERFGGEAPAWRKTVLPGLRPGQYHEKAVADED